MMHFVRANKGKFSFDATVMKVDDDVVVDPFRLLNLIPRWKAKAANLFLSEDAFYCKVNVNASAKREKSAKWYTGFDEWPTEQPFPPYCDGPAYVFTPDVAAKLIGVFEVAAPKPFFWLEDVFATGILSSVGGVRRVHALTPRIFSRDSNVMPWTAALAHMAYDRGGFKAATVWREVLRRHNYSMDKAAAKSKQSKKGFLGLFKLLRKSQKTN